MSDIFAPLKLLLQPRTSNAYNFTFNLYTKYTVIALLAASLLLSAQFVREPISCLTDRGSEWQGIIDTYCWLNGTFVVTGAAGKGIGIEALSSTVWSGYDEQPRYQEHYKWLILLLLLQATFFYAPRYVWKLWAGHELQPLLQVTQNPTQNGGGGGGNGGGDKAAASSNGKNRHVLRLAKYFRTNSHRRRAYVIKFTFCEMLNVCNVLAQAVAINNFLDKEFAYYGYNALLYQMDETNENPMDLVFPKMAKCTFYRYGPSGSIENVDALCLLSWNNVYEIIFLVMWWWFVTLVVFSVVNQVARFCTVFSRCFRFYWLRDAAVLADRSTVRAVVDSRDFADIFILCKIAKGVEYELFDELLRELEPVAKYQGRTQVNSNSLDTRL